MSFNEPPHLFGVVFTLPQIVLNRFLVIEITGDGPRNYCTIQEDGAEAFVNVCGSSVRVGRKAADLQQGPRLSVPVINPWLAE